MEILGKFTFYGTDFNIYNTIEEPLFLVAEIANAVEYSTAAACRMLEHVSNRDKLFLNTRQKMSGNSRGNPWKHFVNTRGLQTMLLMSKKPIAKRFREAVLDILEEYEKGFKDFGSYMEHIDENFTFYPEERIEEIQDLLDYDESLTCHEKRELAKELEYLESVVYSKDM